MFELNTAEYRKPMAILYGIAGGHYCEAFKKDGKTFGRRCVHFLIAMIESIPILGQIAALFEKIVVRCHSKKTKPQKVEGEINRPLRGISNPSLRTCYINAAVMALYPMHKIFVGMKDPILEKMIETYKNPSKHGHQLENLICEGFGWEKKKNDSRQLIRHLFCRMVEKTSPELLPQIALPWGKVRECGHCHAKQVTISFFKHTFGSTGYKISKYESWDKISSI